MTPSILSAEGLSGIVFLCFLAATVAGALIAVGAQRLIRSVAGLALCFLGVAGLYYYLGSPFVALMQLLIYVGAVCVTIVFAIMLAENDDGPAAKRKAILKIAGLPACVVLIWALSALACRTDWVKLPQTGDGSLEGVGRALLTTFGMNFELISLVLLVAIVGSLVLARSGRSKS